MPDNQAQAQDEARRKLADRLAEAISHFGKDLTTAWDWNPSAVKDLRVEIDYADAKEVLAALRADPARGAEEMRERAAKAAEADRGVDDCPYSNDKPGDPTWHHTDDDVCPRCRKIGKDSGSACVGIAKHRIAAAIRALPASDEGGGEL